MENNPLREFLLQLIVLGNDLEELALESNFHETVIHILLRIGVMRDDIQYLNYEIRQPRKGYFKVVAKNIVTALWFSGYFPQNNDLIFVNNSAIFDDKKFKFNKKTKKLTWVRYE